MKAKPNPLLAEQILSNAQLKAIGCLAFHATSLEKLIEDLISLTVGADLGSLLLENKMFGGKLSILKTLLNRITDERLKRQAKSLCERISSDNSSRNTVIHGEWQYNALNALARGSAVAQKKQHSVKADEVIHLAHRFAAHYEDLIDLFAKVFDSDTEPDSLPDISE